jgi:cytochrome c oxidase cbb3-type subunit 3
MVAILAGGAIALTIFRGGADPPPVAIKDDPLLVEGRELYLSRCVSCHGQSGRGDGPTAAILAGPKPGNLTDREWKHGDDPEKVVRVVARGVPNTAMPGWLGTFSEPQVRAVAAYVYWLGGRTVPAALRQPGLPAGASGR